MLGSNQFEELANRCKVVAGADSDYGVVAFTGVHVWLGSIYERPGQVSFLSVFRALGSHRVLDKEAFVWGGRVQHAALTYPGVIGWRTEVSESLPPREIRGAALSCSATTPVYVPSRDRK